MHYDEQREKELSRGSITNEVLSHLKQELAILERQATKHVIGSYELRSYQLRIKSNKILTEKIKESIDEGKLENKEVK